MNKSALAAFAVVSLTFGPTYQGPLPQTSIFAVPDGPLPWSLPPFPTTPLALSAPEVILVELEHSADYVDMTAALEDQADLLVSPLSANVAAVDAFAGTGGVLPDLSAGVASDTGLEPDGSSSLTITDFEAEFVTNMETVISYARLPAALGLAPLAGVFLTIMICMVWILFVRFNLFALQAVDALSTIIPRIVDLVKKVIMFLVGFFGG